MTFFASRRLPVKRTRSRPVPVDHQFGLGLIDSTEVIEAVSAARRQAHAGLHSAKFEPTVAELGAAMDTAEANARTVHARRSPSALDRAEYAGLSLGLAGVFGAVAPRHYSAAEARAFERGYRDGRREFEDESQSRFDAWVEAMERDFGDCPHGWHEDEIARARA
jgi:hypothetical protein